MPSTTSCFRLLFGSSGRTRASQPRSLFTVLAFTCLFWSTYLGYCQSSAFPGQTNVGASGAPMTVTLSLQKAGSLSAIKVVSQGNPNLDFISAGAGSCTIGVSYPAGQTCSVAVSFTPQAPGLRTGAVILAAKDGSALATHFLSGTGVGALGVFVPGEISTLVGHSQWIYSGDGVLGINASIFLPFGIAVDSVGNVFIADSGNSRIRKLTAATGLVSTIAGNGSLGDTGDGGPATQATLSNPASIAIDGAGNIFLCDSGNNAVRKIAAGTGIISTVAGMLGQLGYTGDGSLATIGTLNSPNGIALDASGNLFISDTANNVIRRVDVVSNVISTVAGTGTAGFSGENLLAKSAQLNAPWSVALDTAGGLYIADQGNNRIRRVNPLGVISTVAGNGKSSYSGDNGAATTAALSVPASVVIDVAGNLYIADSGNNRIRKVNASTGVITSIAGSTSQSISGDNGPANVAGLYGPYTLALDGLGNLYIADVFHNRVRVIAANQAVLNFVPMRIGRVAPTQQQTVENDGNTNLTVGLLQPVADSVIDGSTNTCISALALPPLGTCIIGASFAPTSLGTPVNGSIALLSNAINTPDILTLSGNVLTQDPATVTVQASANPIQTGDTVFFTVTAASAGTVPTGQFTLFDGANPLSTVNLSSGGVATFAISTLTGGQHSITASYSGDNNNTAVVSSPLIEVVKDITAATQITVAANQNPVIAGGAVILTATIAPTAAGSGTGAITGPVTFSDGSTILGAASATTGSATLTVSALTVGPHSIVAAYSGISTFAPSTSAALALTVQPGSTSTLLTSSANPSAGGASPTLTAIVASNTTAPIGTVTFLDGTTALGTAPLSPAGIAVLPLPGPSLSIGTHTLVAIYGGDTINSGSSSSALSQIVNLAVTTPVITSSLNPAPQGAPVILTVTVTTTGGIPTGPVQLFDGTVSLGSVTLGADGINTFTTANLGLGNHALTASYQGDALDDVSTSAVFSQVIVPATSTVTLSPSANPSPFGSSLMLSVLVQGTGSQPIGSITLMDGTSSLGTQILDATGLTAFSTSSLVIGAHNLTAIYNGDADHAPNNIQMVEHILQVTSTALNSSTPAAIAGNPVTWSVLVTGVSGQPLTGVVQLKDGANVLATLPTDVNGAATFTSSTLSIGLHPITAVFSGDALDQGSQSIPLLQTVQIATTSTTLASSANPDFTGSTLIVSSTVTGNGATPTGGVTFSDGNVVLRNVPLTASGTASFSISTLTPGVHNLSAVYSGDSNDLPSNAPALAQSVVQQTILTTFSSANPSMFQEAVTITVAVSGGVPAYPATGLVTLSDGGVVLSTQPLNASGNAHFTLAAPVLGSHIFTAVYAGDVNNSPAASLSFTQNVILRPTVTSFVTTSTNLSAGQTVTFISLVQGVGPNIPTGLITFVSGANVLGTAALDSTGLATLTFTPLQASDTVVAQYPGDTLFANSNSSPTNVIVGPTVEFTMNMTPTTVTLASGAHTTLTLSIATASTFTDTLSIGCAGLPPSATCTFSTNDIKVVGGGSTTLTMVLDTGTPLGAGPLADLHSSSPRSIYSCALPGAALVALLLLLPRRCRKQLSLFSLLILLCGSGLLSGCGSSLQVNDTPAGIYAFQVIGRGVISGATQTGNVLLTVTK